MSYSLQISFSGNESEENNYWSKRVLCLRLKFICTQMNHGGSITVIGLV